MKDVTKKNCIELIIAFSILFVALALIKKNAYYLSPVLPLLLLLLRPLTLMPFAKLWMGLGHYLGLINSKILLTAIFFILVTPVAVIRRIFSDCRMTNWNGNLKRETMFVHRHKSFDKEDFDKAF